MKSELYFPKDKETQTEVEARLAPLESAIQAWWARRKTKSYVGSYNSFMSDGGCMSSREGHIRFTPIEEERFCRATLALIQENAQQWSFSGYTARHNPTGLELWTTNGRAWLSVWAPQKIPLRTGTQSKLWVAIHKMRHTRASPESNAFIEKLEAAIQLSA